MRQPATAACSCRARDPRPVPARTPAPARRPARRSCSSPRTRRTPSGSSASPTRSRYVKDAFHEYVVHGRPDAVNPQRHRHQGRRALRARRSPPAARSTVAPAAVRRGRGARASRSARPSTRVFAERIARGRRVLSPPHPAGRAGRGAPRSPARPTPGCSGRKQFYHYVVKDWLDGDPAQPPPPAEPQAGPQPRLGATSSTATSSRCPTSGSTPGTPPGTWPST